MFDAKPDRRWITPAVLGLLAAIFFLPGLVSEQVPVFRDLLVLVIPLRSYAREVLRSGELPLWTPQLFFGAPFLANYQSAVLYPPSVVLYALPFPFAFSFFLAFHLFVGGLGMSRYLRRRCGLAVTPALFGTVVFVFGGFLTSLIPLTNQLEVAVWLPWVLDAGEELLETGGAGCWFRLTGFLTLQALGGAPEAMLLGVTLLAADCARKWFQESFSAPRLLAIVTALLLALGLAAIQLLPTAEYAAHTDRAEVLTLAAAGAESLQPGSFLQFLLPHTFSGDVPNFVPQGKLPLFWSLYIGVASLAMVGIALPTRPMRFWLAVLAIATALALGPSIPVFPYLYAVWPTLFGAFRFPGKFFLISHFALAVAAAHGLSRITAVPEQRRRALVVLLLLALAGAIVNVIALASPEACLNILGYEFPKGMSASTYSFLAIRVGWTATRLMGLGIATALLVWLFHRGRMAARTFAAAVVALTAAELLLVHAPATVFTDWTELREAANIESLQITPDDRLFHFCVRGCLPPGAMGLGPWAGTVLPGESVRARARSLWAALVPNVPMFYGAGGVAGSDGFSTRDQREFYQALALLPRDRALRLLAGLGVSRLIGPEPLEGSRASLISSADAPDGSKRWLYALPDASPRSYLAERVLVASDPRLAIERVAAEDFCPGRDAVVIGDPETVSMAIATGTLEKIAFGRETVSAQASLAAPGLWVVSDTWYSGWTASIDGSPVEILRVNGLVRGLWVPAGEHRLEMRYRPRSFRLGLQISIASVIILIAVAGARLLRKAVSE